MQNVDIFVDYILRLEKRRILVVDSSFKESQLNLHLSEETNVLHTFSK